MSNRDILRVGPSPLPRIGVIPIVYSTDWTKRQIEKDRTDKLDRLGDKTREEQKEAMSVALAQPHRRGNPARKAATPLGRFCEETWARDKDHAHKMYVAGCSYEQIVRDSLIAQGLPYLGQAAGAGGESGLTEEEMDAAREKAKRKRSEADYALAAIDKRAVGVMRRVCYEQETPGPYDGGILLKALYRLADWLGLVDHGINALDRVG